MTELFRRYRIKRAQGKKGFTLIELIIVIAILAILGTVVGVVMGAQVENAKKSVVQMNASTYYGDLQSAWTWDMVGPVRYFGNITTKMGSQALADFLKENVDNAMEGTIYVFMDTSDALAGVSGVMFAPAGVNYVGYKGTCSDGTNTLDESTTPADTNSIAAAATFAITVSSTGAFTYTDTPPTLSLS